MFEGNVFFGKLFSKDITRSFSKNQYILSSIVNIYIIVHLEKLQTNMFIFDDGFEKDKIRLRLKLHIVKKIRR